MMHTVAKAFRSPQVRQRGQTLVEFALVVIFLVVVMVGSIDFARLMYTYGVISNAAREGARYGIIYPNNIHAGFSPDPNNIMYRVNSKLLLIKNSTENPYIEVLFPDNCRSVGCRISVRVTVWFRPWTFFIPRLRLVSQSTMYIE